MFLDLVYRHYDQATLDRECNPSLLIEGSQRYLDDYAERSLRLRKRHCDWSTASYGPGRLRQVDVFRPSGAAHAPRPVQVFFHGGGWHLLSKDESSFVVDGLGSQGAIVVVASYTLVPEVTLDGVVEDAFAVMRWVLEHAADFDGDPDRLFISGHSAGAHLAAMILTEAGRRLPAGMVKGALLMSGNYNLEPIRLSARNQRLRLDRETADRNSPSLRAPMPGPQVIVSFGEFESRQYKDQGNELAANWCSGGVACQVVELSGANHFEAVLELAKPDSTIVREFLAMGKTPAGSAKRRAQSAASEAQGEGG
jgi:arylformamidase